MRGGWRSGAGRLSYKSKMEYHRRIDVRRWAREGMLVSGRYFGWQWSNENGEQVASINVRIENTHSLTLLYRWRSNGKEWCDESVPVRLGRTACNYGGDRVWFICPHCGRRAATLYFASETWACRTSLKLAYACQSEDTLDRLHRRKSKLESKLRRDGRGKPKGMHKKTYEQLRDMWINAEIAWEDEFEIRAAGIIGAL